MRSLLPLRSLLFCLSFAVACAETEADPECVDGFCPELTITADATVVIPDAGGNQLIGPDAAVFVDAMLPVYTTDASPANDAAPADSSTTDASQSDGSVAPNEGYQRGPAPTKQSASAQGTYKVESYTSGFRDGPKYADATIWYPTDATPPYAIVSVVPGFVSAQSSIRNWGPFLASHGIVTITIGTNTPGDLPKQRAEALIDALETLKSEHTRSGSPLNGKIDGTRTAVMGWSMGGGGTMWASRDNPTLKAAVSLCGWEPGPQFQTNKVPAFIFAATGDGVASTNGHSINFYNQIPAPTPKTLLEIRGGTHSSANDPANHNRVIGLYGLSWLKVYLEGDQRYAQFLKEGPSEAARYLSANY